MFDWLRNRGKSEAEKRAEMLTAYVDGELSARDMQQFESLLAEDAGLRANLEAEQVLKQQLRRLPRLRSPRNFTLNLADFPAREPTLAEILYPRLRVATAAAAVLLVGLLSLELLTPTLAPQTESIASLALEPTQVELTMEAEGDVAADEETFDASAGEADTFPLQTAPAAADANVAADSPLAEEAPPEAEEAEIELAAEEAATAAPAGEESEAEAGVSAAAIPAATATAGPQPTQVLSAPRPEATPTLVTRAEEPAAALEPVPSEPAATAVADTARAPEAEEVEGMNEAEEAAPTVVAPAPLVDWLRILQISLAAIVVGLVVTTVLLRRRL